MSSNTSVYALMITIANLQPNATLTVTLTSSDAVWAMTDAGGIESFAIRPLGGQPLSLEGVGLTPTTLTVSAGISPLACAITANVSCATAVSGTTQSNDPGVSVEATTSRGVFGLAGAWTIDFS